MCPQNVPRVFLNINGNDVDVAFDFQESQPFSTFFLKTADFFLLIEYKYVPLWSRNRTMQGKVYFKYIWLLNLLLEKDLSFDSIQMYWRQSPMYNGSDLPSRTFHDYRSGIKEMFGVEIECLKSRGYLYHVKNPEVLNSRAQKWLLQNYSIPDGFATFSMMQGRIVLEKIPGGSIYVKPIIDAMMKNVEITIDYQPHGGSNHTYTIQPYALKVFGRRWYLLGHSLEGGDIRTFALDRFLAMKLTQKEFKMPESFDAHKYFDNVVGIYVNGELPVEMVKIRAYGNQAEYLESLPIHKSQQIGWSVYGEFTEYTYRLSITPELVSQLLSMSENVEVLEPAHLRDEIIAKLQGALDRYQK